MSIIALHFMDYFILFNVIVLLCLNVALISSLRSFRKWMEGLDK